MPDPELPVLTIADLGVLRDVEVGGRRRRRGHDHADLLGLPGDGGDPARRRGARSRDAGFADVRVRTVLAPAWTTDWISDRGRAALQEYGIAPPGRRGSGTGRA